MMKVSTQVDNLPMLKEALESRCDGVRFGSEFCEWKIPRLETLKKAYELTSQNGKEFTYITPRVSNQGLEEIQQQFAFINNEAEIEVVINDLGVLYLMEQFPNLRPHLGRQLIFIPARCPWDEITQQKLGFLAKRKVEKIFFQTSLNYSPTINFYKRQGIQRVDLDWIPRVFPNFNFLVRNGLSLSVYLHLVPITLTRRCHTARFLDVQSLENCPRPCYKRAFLLKHETLDVEWILHGNVVFKFFPPSREEIQQLRNYGVSEFVITMTPATAIENQHSVDGLLKNLRI